jgi:uncharacterized membrane protein
VSRSKIEKNERRPIDAREVLVLGISVYMLVFRLLHIAIGVAWVGSVFLFVVFLQPAAAEIGPAGAPFMAELLGRRRLTDRIVGLGVGTVVAGLFLYWHDWQAYGGFGDWIGSSFGAVITLGMVATLVALAIGIFWTRPMAARFGALGQQVAAAGGPTPEQGSEMARLQRQLRVFAWVNLSLLAIAVFAMATARYW